MRLAAAIVAPGSLAGGCYAAGLRARQLGLFDLQAFGYRRLCVIELLTIISGIAGTIGGFVAVAQFIVTLNDRQKPTGQAPVTPAVRIVRGKVRRAEVKA